MTNPSAQSYAVFLRAECSGQHFPYDRKNHNQTKTPTFLRFSDWSVNSQSSCYTSFSWDRIYMERKGFIDTKKYCTARSTKRQSLFLISAIGKGWFSWYMQNGASCYQDHCTWSYKSAPWYLDLYRDVFETFSSLFCCQ